MTTERQNCLAICAIIFCSIALGGLLLFGAPHVQKLAILSALLGAAGQFVAQDGRRACGIAANVLAYAAFAVAAVALYLF